MKLRRVTVVGVLVLVVLLFPVLLVGAEKPGRSFANDYGFTCLYSESNHQVGLGFKWSFHGMHTVSGTGPQALADVAGLFDLQGACQGSAKEKGPNLVNNVCEGKFRLVPGMWIADDGPHNCTDWEGNTMRVPDDFWSSTDYWEGSWTWIPPFVAEETYFRFSGRGFGKYEGLQLLGKWTWATVDGPFIFSGTIFGKPK